MTGKNKIYTAADFERYHSGVMPVNEMHELEKAALEDPFLADALEGYPYTPSFENDIAELKEKLNEKQKKKNVFFITSFGQRGWWRIAALFIIIAGIGYFFYSLNYNNNKNSLAKNEIKSIVQKKDSTIGINDTASQTNNIAFENNQSSNDEETKKNTLLKIKSNAEKGTLNWKSESDSIKFNMRSGKNQEQALSEYALKGKVTDENGKPLALATIKNKSKSEVTVTDTTGKFLLKSSDSNTTAIVSVAGYETKKVELEKDKEAVIAMNKNNRNLNEVVVSGYAQSQKLNNATSEDKVLKNQGSGITTQSFPTLDNTTDFNEYLKENSKPVFDEHNNKLSGEVLLSFIVNKKGRPHHIKVIRSSCKACEKEAVTLLESGPGWINENHRLKTVLIKF